MLDGISFLLASLARRLRHRRPRNKRIASSAAIFWQPFFSCGSGCDSFSPFVKVKTVRKLKGPHRTPTRMIVDHDQAGADADEPCLWRRTILLGQRCQPLEFNEAIHYDSEGQRLWRARTPPRPPLLSPVRSMDFGCMDRV